MDSTYHCPFMCCIRRITAPSCAELLCFVDFISMHPWDMKSYILLNLSDTFSLPVFTCFNSQRFTPHVIDPTYRRLFIYCIIVCGGFFSSSAGTHTSGVQVARKCLARRHSRNGPWTWRHAHTHVGKQQRNRIRTHVQTRNMDEWHTLETAINCVCS